MNVRTREQILLQTIQLKENSLPAAINDVMYNYEKVRLGPVLYGISTYAKMKAIAALYIDSDFVQFRQHCYLSSILMLKNIDKEGGIFPRRIDLMYAILSDNEQLIVDFSNISPDDMSREDKFSVDSAEFYMFQLALKGDDKSLVDLIDKMSSLGSKSSREDFKNGRDFFSLLIKKNVQGLSELISEKHAKIKNADPVTEDFISPLATIETKICWRRGIEIAVESELVPMKVMPILQLIKYEDVYDFLRPDWNPTTVGFLGKVKHVFGEFLLNK